MGPVPCRSLSGRDVILSPDQLSHLSSSITGGVLTGASAEYEHVRQIWNAMIDRRPSLIARCRTAADVQAAVRFSRQHDLLVSVRGAGHNIAGLSLADGALLIDLSLMKSVTVNDTARTAHVEPGVTLAELDAATQAHGLALPTGINSTTGIAGLTLGGGFGWISRHCGLTIDNLLGADVVLADGSLVRASASDDADLFWAIRGGGGNFGIATAFDFKLHPVGPTVIAGLIVHPIAAAASVLRQYRDYVTKHAPEELTAWCVMRLAPPLPFLPEAWHGKPVLVMAMAHCGTLEAGAKAVEPLKRIGSPIADIVGPMPYAGWQQAFDPLLTPGARNYWKSHDFPELSDQAIDTFLASVSEWPTAETEAFIAHLGGAVRRVADDATAYGARDGIFVLNVHGRWRDAADDQRCLVWLRGVFNTMAPFATGTAYVNFMTEEEGGRVATAYGANHARLARLKRRYDPANVFRMTQNIKPAAG